MRRLVDDEVLANGVFGAFCAVGAVVPALSPTFARVAERVSGERSFTDRSHAVFTSRRRVRFREMEYAVPLEAVPTALREIRARIARTLMDEAQQGNIRLTIARAADFYGTNSPNSVMDSLVLAKLAKGQKAMWIGDPSRLHSFTYVPDAARAIYKLVQHPQRGGIWHLPTAPALSGIQLMEMAAQVFGHRMYHHIGTQLERAL